MRLPAHPAPRHLARLAGGAVIGTSANISGSPPKRSIDEVLVELYDAPIDYFLDGGVSLSDTPSTVVNLCKEEPIVERLGAVPLEALVKLLPGVKVKG